MTDSTLELREFAGSAPSSSDGVWLLIGLTAAITASLTLILSSATLL